MQHMTEHTGYEIGKARLWMDGTGRVSVPITLFVKDQTHRIKLIMSPSDVAGNVWAKLDHADRIIIHDEKFTLRVLNLAEKTRRDPVQLQKLTESRKRAVRGAGKSLAALKERILLKKEVMFKASIQDLMNRGLSRRRIAQLVRDAIVEGVHDQ